MLTEGGDARVRRVFLGYVRPVRDREPRFEPRERGLVHGEVIDALPVEDAERRGQRRFEDLALIVADEDEDVGRGGSEGLREPGDGGLAGRVATLALFEARLAGEVLGRPELHELVERVRAAAKRVLGVFAIRLDPLRPLIGGRRQERPVRCRETETDARHRLRRRRDRLFVRAVTDFAVFEDVPILDPPVRRFEHLSRVRLEHDPLA